MRISETPERLTIRQLPYFRWTLGVIFCLSFLAITLFFLNAVWENPRNFLGGPETGMYDRITSWATFLILFLFVATVNIALASLIGSPIIKTEIDRNGKFVMISRRGLFGGDTKRFLFSQVKNFAIEVPPVDRTASFLALRLVNGELVRIDDDPRKDSKEIVNRLNRFLRSSSD